MFSQVFANLEPDTAMTKREIIPRLFRENCMIVDWDFEG
jgi:hypothetical protein